MRQFRAIFAVGVGGLALARLTAAETPFEISQRVLNLANSTGCVAPAAFDDCMKTVNSTSLTCNPNDGNPCGPIGLVDSINCYLRSCWNKIYSCHYQWIVESLVQSFDFPESTIPGYPVPEDAPERCSCDWARLWLARRIPQCSSNCNTSQRPSGYYCCSLSFEYSTIHDICPATEPDIIQISEFLNDIRKSFESEGLGCKDSFNPAICSSLFSIPPSGTFTPIDPLPTWTGTAPLGEVGSKMASPLFGETFTWAVTGAPYRYFDGLAYAITASTYPTATATRTGRGSGNSTGTGTGVSGRPTETSKTGNAIRPRTSANTKYIALFIMAFALV